MNLQYVEYAACLFTVVCVWQVSRQSIWNFLTGIIGVLLYGYLFLEVRLYADATLQLAYFLPIQLYGYWYWYTKGPQPDTLGVTVSSNVETLLLLGLVCLGTASAGFFYRWLGAALPYPDSFILCASVVAQYLLSKKRLDSWMYWIVVDLVAIPVYAYKELYVTTALYVVLLVLCCIGYRKWRRTYYDDLAPEFGR